MAQRKISIRLNLLIDDRCIMSDDSGTVNLAGIHQNPDGSPKWSIYAPDYWYYDYNPCRGFTKMEFSDLAVS